jgi:hypothetical protein
MLADRSRSLPPVRGLHLLPHTADRGRVARGTTLRHLRPARFRRSRSRGTVEGLTGRIAYLVTERQQLRMAEASSAALERNRVQLARAQWELAHALIERHLPAAQTAA